MLTVQEFNDLIELQESTITQKIRSYDIERFAALLRIASDKEWKAVCSEAECRVKAKAEGLAL